MTVPYAAQRGMLESLARALSGKIVVTTVVPLRFDAGEASFLQIEAGSAAMEARETLPDSRIVAAFQTVSAHDLLNPARRPDSDVVVCSDDEEAKKSGLRPCGRDSGHQGCRWRRSAERGVRRAHYSADIET